MEEQKKMVSIIKENPENKVYLVCLRTDSGDFWDIIEGRENVWEYIKDKCIYNNVNVEESFVLVDSLTLRKRKSVYDFMKYFENFINDPDGFDIEDYVNGDVIGETESESESSTIESEGHNSLLMEDIMNGAISTQEL